MNGDTIAVIRRSKHGYSDNELFTMALRKWKNHKESVDIAIEFILSIVANQLEEELLLWLLQSHANDTVDDIEIFLTICSNPSFIVNGIELLETLLDVLVTVAIVRAAACDRSDMNRSRQMAEIMSIMMESRVLMLTSKAYNVLQLLTKCHANKEDTDLWTKFVELPSTLDTQLFNSRSGRAFLDCAEQIIFMQQTELEEMRGTSRVCASGEVNGGQTLTAKILWDLTKQLVELIKTKTVHSDVKHDHYIDSGTTQRLAVVDNMTDLEMLLKAKGTSGQSCTNIPSTHVVDDEDTELSAIELLSTFCTSPDRKELISRDILEKAFDELSATKQLNVISIQVSFLLGLQMRRQVCFVDHCESAKVEFGRRIRRVFNRLTDKARDIKHVASLVVLSAFYPGQIVRQCITGARADMLHHSLYIEVFRASPLLLDWTEGAENGSTTLLECQLQQAVFDVSSNQSSFDQESHNVISFLLSVVGIPIRSLSKREAPVMTINKLLDKVINPVCYSVGLRHEPHLNLYTLVQQLFQYFVAANTCRDLDCNILESSFNLILKALCSFDAHILQFGVLIRERLLLLLIKIMELMPGPASMIKVEQLDTPLHPSLWTLLSIFDSNLVNDELSKGLEDVALVDAFMQGKSIGDSQSSLSLSTVTSAIQALLWGLLWDTTLPAKLRVKSTQTETWSLVDGIAGCEFLRSDSATETISGALLIQSAIAEMMLGCGSVLFQALLSNIIPYLLEYETETSSSDRLEIPNWAADKLPKQQDIEQQIPCGLVSTHSIMRYVTRCWGLSSAVNVQLATQDSALLLESLSHVLASHEPAITSSQGSLSGSLFCIQWLCVLTSTALEMQLDKMPAWPTLRTQLELLLLRLLHQLVQLKETSTSKAQFSQCFVAAWLAYLPAGQFAQVFKFVQAR
ncbi:unnamed protein product [Peronospora belbahrii]|uniref:Uncharacterized protein n=1 Tax=Peronospora belbahrii TaxID=622444 RepID=A0ABN8CQ91_9STRA|nr:unnamed protein product [Peronospora belbahrii]